MTIKVVIKSEKKIICLNAKKGDNLLQLLRNNKIAISSPCAGNKSCGKCKVKLIIGHIPISEAELILLTEEEIKSGFRLACSIKIVDEMTIELVGEGQLQVMTDGIDTEIDFDPAVRLHNWQKEQIQTIPREGSINSYLDTLKIHTKTDQINMSGLRVLAKLMENEEISLISYYNKILSVSNKQINKIYGLAVDIGTTTVAVYLMNLHTGEEIDVESFHNPQKIFGADVISRIHYIKKGSVKEVQEAIIKGLNQAIVNLSFRNNIKKGDIYLLTAVGNTIMLHFFLGVNPQSMAKAPYRPVFLNLIELNAADVNLRINPEGIVQVLPSVSAYIGSDILADLIVADFDNDEWNLLIDIGTNGEIVLGNRHRMLACSTAAGPAFEGAKISFGTAGISGAVSQFNISSDRQFIYKTIDSVAPIGICGSGLIDIISELINNNILNKTGSFNEDLPGIYQEKMINYKNIKAIKIVDAEFTTIDSHILLTQKDVRELQLAKGAIAAGINILLKEAEIEYQDIKKIYLAGGFGNFINPINACTIGLLPLNMENKIVKIGNGAGLGAKSFLLDKKQKKKVLDLSKKIEYLELSLHKDFQNEFMKSIEFGG